MIYGFLKFLGSGAAVLEVMDLGILISKQVAHSN